MFLESQDIIDYSLLLGVHFRAPEHLKSLEPPDALCDHENSPVGDGRYHFLMPDVLIVFDKFSSWVQDHLDVKRRFRWMNLLNGQFLTDTYEVTYCDSTVN